MKFLQLKILLFLFLIGGGNNILFSQTKICNYCNNEISGKYLSVENKYYHPDHFFCSLCNKPIREDYNKHKNLYYHPFCYKEVALEKCALCNKPIEGKYYIKGNKKYHDQCYVNNHAEFCDVCGKPLIGKYFVDIYSMKYHTYHEKEFPKCDNCNRIISSRTTGGGVEYKDGRKICNICANRAVAGYSEINQIFKRVALALNKMGLDIDLNNVEVFNVNRNELRRIAKDKYNSSMKGYCNTTIQRISDGNTIRENKSFKVYLIENIPSEYIESTSAHELMHIWIAQNTNIDHDPKLEEGSCNYVSYLYMQKRANKTAEYITTSLETDPHPIYGGGFMKVKNKFKYKPFKSFLNYLSRNSSL